MIARNFYFQIIIRVVCIAILSAFAGWLTATGKPLLPIVLVLFADILFICFLIHFINTTNRKIGYFLESVQNDDSTLSIPTNINDKTILTIHQGLNKVNKQIQQLKIENRQKEQYFQSIIEHLATGLITFNNKGFILHTNSTAKSLLGLDVLTHIQQLDRVDKKLYQTIKTISPYERKLVSIISERGEVQLAIKASSFKMHDEELMIISIQDIRNELDEKELESWMKLIRVLMHEIMNSITPITSLSETLMNIFNRDGLNISPDKLDARTISTVVQGLNVIRTQGKGLTSFVESYRKLTRIPEPQKKPVNLTDLITRIKILYNSLEGSDRTKLIIKLEKSDIVIIADEDQISLVLINLLKNAIESNKDNNSALITITAGFNSGNFPEICISDNGPGIPAENIDKIFVPFFTTRKEGSGIGLSISKQIMRLHGGNLKVKSNPGKETVFCLSFGK